MNHLMKKTIIEVISHNSVIIKQRIVRMIEEDYNRTHSRIRQIRYIINYINNKLLLI